MKMQTLPRRRSGKETVLQPRPLSVMLSVLFELAESWCTASEGRDSNRCGVPGQIQVSIEDDHGRPQERKIRRCTQMNTDKGGKQAPRVILSRKPRRGDGDSLRGASPLTRVVAPKPEAPAGATVSSQGRTPLDQMVSEPEAPAGRQWA